MSVYIPEWLNGYDSFLTYGDLIWAPQIKLKTDPEDADSDHVLAAAAFFNVESLSELIKELGPGTGHEFFKRFNLASSVVFKVLKMTEFLDTYLGTTLKATDGNLEESEKILLEVFNRHIINFEFWNKTDIVTLYANLIFYGTFDYPSPLVFFVPPKSKWGNFPNGWFGYNPFLEEDD